MANCRVPVSIAATSSQVSPDSISSRVDCVTATAYQSRPDLDRLVYIATMPLAASPGRSTAPAPVLILRIWTDSVPPPREKLKRPSREGLRPQQDERARLQVHSLRGQTSRRGLSFSTVETPLCSPEPPWWLTRSRVCLRCRRPGFHPRARKGREPVILLESW